MRRVEWERDGHVISDDAARLDVERVWRWLAEESYWAVGRGRGVVERSISGSVNLGLYRPGGEQGGFCRWVTDGATFAWLCDVFVDEEARGSGLGTWMVATAVEHPVVRDVRRQMLATADAHGLYARFGFVPLAAPDRWMERIRPA